jgi:hypothetical protein
MWAVLSMFVAGRELCLLRIEMLYELSELENQHYKKKSIPAAVIFSVVK